MANNLFQQVRTDVKNFQSTESMLFSNESDQQLRLSCYLKLLGHTIVWKWNIMASSPLRMAGRSCNRKTEI